MTIEPKLLSEVVLGRMETWPTSLDVPDLLAHIAALDQQIAEARGAVIAKVEMLAAKDAEIEADIQEITTLREIGDKLIAKIAVKDAEIRRLKDNLRYQDWRDHAQITHGPDCETWGPAHYECALNKLRARAAPQIKDIPHG